MDNLLLFFRFSIFFFYYKKIIQIILKLGKIVVISDVISVIFLYTCLVILNGVLRSPLSYVTSRVACFAFDSVTNRSDNYTLGWVHDTQFTLVGG